MAPKPSTFTTLGTAGGPVPNPQRAQPAHVLMHGEEPILIDCGDGAVGQLIRAGVDYRSVNRVFLSHHHFDHIGGLFALLGVNMMTMRKTPLTIYGPPGTKAIVDGIVAASSGPNEIGFGVPGQALPKISDFVSVREITPTDTVTLDGLTVTCCENTHYRPEAELGTPGPLSLSLRFDLADRSVLFTGDTGPCKAVEALAKGVDLVIGEMMDIELIMGRIRAANPNQSAAHIAKIQTHISDHHITAEQLADLAEGAGASHVVATHLPPGVATPKTAPEYAARIQARFSGSVSISQDLESY
ncbi:MBL fold metallo-hydrolase [Pararhodobacter sp.]|uniref:MBL fold metallo-hydrolase n=1 Tax=Pararhodobacter sp. TaxID=2127056 RepID=UPI002AFDD6D1|nr:MBL fold metallo-hydrolase [Pararhodobacter sp.]